jgi:exopolysaccharide production protein ExoZ
MGANRATSVQNLRGVAVSLVLLHHSMNIVDSAGKSGSRFAGLFWNKEFGASGVDLFFVISGFVMGLCLEKEAPDHGMAQFLKKRFVRIVPLFWSIGLICACERLIVGDPFTGSAVLNSITFLPVFDGGRYDLPVLAVGWTLAFEFLLYGIVALSLPLPRQYRSTFALIVLTGSVSIGWITAPRGAGASFMTNPILLEFVLGMAAQRVLRTSAARRLQVPMLVGGVFLLLWKVKSGFGYSMDPWPLIEGRTPLQRVTDWGTPWMMVVFGSYGLTCQRSRLTSIGDASYSIYLAHPLVNILAAALAPCWMALDPDWTIVIILGGGLGLGLAVHHGLERPLSSRFPEATSGAPTRRRLGHHTRFRVNDA